MTILTIIGAFVVVLFIAGIIMHQIMLHGHLDGLQAQVDALASQVVDLTQERLLPQPDGGAYWRQGPYSYMEFPEAARAYLGSVAPERKTTSELADALKAGGFRTVAKDFRSSAGAMLKRPSAIALGIIRTDDGRWTVASMPMP